MSLPSIFSLIGNQYLETSETFNQIETFILDTSQMATLSLEEIERAVSSSIEQNGGEQTDENLKKLYLSLIKDAQIGSEDEQTIFQKLAAASWHCRIAASLCEEHPFGFIYILLSSGLPFKDYLEAIKIYFAEGEWPKVLWNMLWNIMETPNPKGSSADCKYLASYYPQEFSAEVKHLIDAHIDSYKLGMLISFCDSEDLMPACIEAHHAAFKERTERRKETIKLMEGMEYAASKLASKVQFDGIACIVHNFNAFINEDLPPHFLELSESLQLSIMKQLKAPQRVGYITHYSKNGQALARWLTGLVLQPLQADVKYDICKSVYYIVAKESREAFFNHLAKSNSPAIAYFLIKLPLSAIKTFKFAPGISWQILDTRLYDLPDRDEWLQILKRMWIGSIFSALTTLFNLSILAMQMRSKH